MVYTVIDTNVFVSAIIAAHSDSATVIIREKIMDGTIVVTPAELLRILDAME